MIYSSFNIDQSVKNLPRIKQFLVPKKGSIYKARAMRDLLETEFGLPLEKASLRGEVVYDVVPEGFLLELAPK